MVKSHANVTQVVFRRRLFGLRGRRLLLHAGDLLGKDTLSGRKVDVERGNFLFDGSALPFDLDVQFRELSAQGILLAGLRRRRLLLHAGDLLGKGALSGREMDVKRRNFLFDSLALFRDVDVQVSELSAQRIPLPEQVTDVVDKPVCLDDVIEPLPQLAETVRKLAQWILLYATTIIASSLSHTGDEPVASYLKVLSTSFYRYTRCITGSNKMFPAGTGRRGQKRSSPIGLWRSEPVNPGGCGASLPGTPHVSRLENLPTRQTSAALQRRRVQRMLPVWPSE
jgi:hypothetical protein